MKNLLLSVALVAMMLVPSVAYSYGPLRAIARGVQKSRARQAERVLAREEVRVERIQKQRAAVKANVAQRQRFKEVRNLEFQRNVGHHSELIQFNAVANVNGRQYLSRVTQRVVVDNRGRVVSRQNLRVEPLRRVNNGVDVRVGGLRIGVGR
jgi:hypothetical protein